MNMDKFIYKEEGELKMITSLEDVKERSPLLIACDELGIEVKDYLKLRKLLSRSQRERLSVINPVGKGQYKVYIKEMCKILYKGDKLDSKYLRVINSK